jgi:hypothetical protein
VDPACGQRELLDLRGVTGEAQVFEPASARSRSAC